MILST
jgi:hypothetical protein